MEGRRGGGEEAGERRGEGGGGRGGRRGACAYEIVEPGPELIGVTELSLSLAFRFIDQTLGRVLAEAQREREEVIGGALARCTETIRLILDGAPIDPTAASRRLGYELDRRHTAVVVWAESAVAPHGALESAAVLLAQAAGSQRPLTLPAGTTTLWAWIGTPSEPAIEDLRSAVARSPEDVRAAVGPTRRGIEGFRASHEAALTVHRFLLGNPASGRFGSIGNLRSPRSRPTIRARRPSSSRRRSARLPRTTPPPPDCEKRCVSTLRRPTTHRAPQPGCTPTATPSSSGSHARPSYSVTSLGSGGSPSSWPSSYGATSSRRLPER